MNRAVLSLMMQHLLQPWTSRPWAPELVIDHAEDGQQALDLLARNAYDIVFMDLMMPAMDGATVIGEMRTAGIRTPVVVVTAMDHDSVAKMPLPSVASVVFKPLEQAKLQAALITVMEHRATA